MSRGTHNNTVKIVEDSSDATFWGTTVFNERKIAEKTQQFILNANVPLSTQRDKLTETNNATITKQGAEYRVRATSDTGSMGALESRRRGNYISGNEGEAGLGVRVPIQPTGDGVIRWGYFEDTTNRTGFYYEYTADGIFAVVEDNGTIASRVIQKDWNINKVASDRGFGPLDPSNGYVYQIRFVHYGYGPVVFEVGKSYLDNRYNVFPVHLENINEKITIPKPNLPLRIEVDSGTSGQQLDCFVGGRQFSTFGKINPIQRQVGAYRVDQGSVETTFVPAVSFREKAGFENIIVTLRDIEFLSDSDMIYEIRKNATLTNAVFDTPGTYLEDEVATEWDVSATVLTGGETLKAGFIEGGNKTNITKTKLLDRIIYEDDVYTVCVRTATGSNATISTLFEVAEGW